MNLSLKESVDLARALAKKSFNAEVVICPTFTALAEVKKALGKSAIGLGAQNVHFENAGAFTGEVSPKQLKEVGCTHVIIGHSERRAMKEETYVSINKKIIAAMSSGITPIICVGETKEDRKSGKARAVVVDQVKGALHDLHTRAREALLFAYEPVWAIGGGVAATPADVVAMHMLIRSTIETAVYGIKTKQIRVLYGGSIDEKNAERFLSEREVDGLLVGGASLKLGSFSAIIGSAQ